VLRYSQKKNTNLPLKLLGMELEPGEGNNNALGLVDRVEEGRIALYQLERHLKDSQKGGDQIGDSGSVSSNRQFSLKSERSILDQTARDARLHYRKDSPLGLTVEELDDRGLLDGGSVPSYYTSIRQRTRRPLEMKKRGTRMQERNTNKMLKNAYHMIRTLVKRGLRIEEYCRQYDTGNCGMIDKKRFKVMIRNIGLPLTPKEIMDLMARYAVPSTEMVDFEALLRDANVALISKTIVSDIGNNNDDLVGQDSVESLRGADVGMYTGVLLDMKRMLIESAQSLGKSLGDVYRMFARWDNEGTGTVTATQFLRVLARLHIDLSDQDQDFVVELLDTNAQGRIDFEGLLSFCFAETVPELGSPNGVSIRAMFLEDEAARSAGGNDTMSAMSYEGLNEQKSIGSTGLEEIGGGGGGDNDKGVQWQQEKSSQSMRNPASRRPHTAGKVRKSEYSTHDSGATGAHREGGSGGASGEGEYPEPPGSSPGKADSKRPVTALPRVSSQDIHDRSQRKDQHQGEETKYHALELPDFIVNDYEEDDYMGSLTPISNMPPNFEQGEVDAASLNDNTLITEHNEENNWGSPQGMPSSANNHHNSNKPDLNGGSLEGLTVSQDSRDFDGLPPRHRGNQPALSRAPDSLESLIAAPHEHIAMLVEQTLATLREMIISRHRTGKTLQEIFQHFDRDGKGFFGVKDFIRGASDLRIETSERVATPAVNQIAIDDEGEGKVRLGEFIVFVTDPDHKTLETNIRGQVANLLLKAGSEEGLRNRLFEVFWKEDSRRPNQQQYRQQPGVVSTSSFISALGALELHLSISEVDRLIARFDVSGNGGCNVERFINMVSSGEAWRRATSKLASSQQAKWEAGQLRQELRTSSSRRAALHNAGITEEVISMAEYLGIRVLSEQNLLWIAADAFKAPLPVSWSSQKDSTGRTFFYNHLTNESSWDHPLDPHFRQLIDGYRQGNMPGMNPITVPFDVMDSPPPKSTDPRFTQIPANLHPPMRERPRSALPAADKSTSWKEQQQQHARNVINANYSQLKQGRAIEERYDALFGGSSRPSSAPNHIRKSNSDKSNYNKNDDAAAAAAQANMQQYTEGRTRSYKEAEKKAYGQQYFNLSHYKQNGYKTEEVERLHRQAREAAQGMGGPTSFNNKDTATNNNNAGRAARRPQSSGAVRRPRSGAATGRPARTGSATGQRPQSGAAAGGGRNYADFTTYQQNAGEQDPNALSAQAHRPSVVDRALYGEALPTWLQPKERSNWQEPAPKYDVNALTQEQMTGGATSTQDRLADMYGPDLLQKLDNLHGSPTASSSEEPRWN
jgi:Ca2+-binding EF-hand superfamily protein